MLICIRHQEAKAQRWLCLTRSAPNVEPSSSLHLQCIPLRNNIHKLMHLTPGRAHCGEKHMYPRCVLDEAGCRPGERGCLPMGRDAQYVIAAPDTEVGRHIAHDLSGPRRERSGPGVWSCPDSYEGPRCLIAWTLACCKHLATKSLITAVVLHHTS